VVAPQETKPAGPVVKAEPELEAKPVIVAEVAVEATRVSVNDEPAANTMPTEPVAASFEPAASVEQTDIVPTEPVAASFEPAASVEQTEPEAPEAAEPSSGVNDEVEDEDEDGLL
jgi:hypothetical protein